MPVPIKQNEINTEKNLKKILSVKDYEDVEFLQITRKLLEEIGTTRIQLEAATKALQLQ